MNKPMHIHHFSVSISCIHLLLKRSFAAYLQQAHKLIVGEICVALFRRLNSIAEINDDKETWKIDVRLINMWIIPRGNSPRRAGFLRLKDLACPGTYPISIQNSMYGSQIFVNSDIKEIVDFKDCMDPSQLTMIHCTQSGNQISGSSLYSVGDRFMHNAKMIYFDEVSKVKKDLECYALINEIPTDIKQRIIDELSQDEALINSIVAKLPTFDLQQCFSTTAESNPLLSGSITPAKHNLVLSNTQLDDIPFEDLSSIQLSSIGVTKHIKIE
ncbi:hypothetical protein GmHk_04G010696 [Glycine max]|nr:hypothetical protein GmHk_04G010696 [Glycine max]